MPTSVREALAAARLKLSGVVPWGTTVPAPANQKDPRSGVYVIALTEDPDSKGSRVEPAPISMEAIASLLTVRPELTLDGKRPSSPDLSKRLGEFWLPDEVILYIGLAGQRKRRPPKGELAKRVGEFYSTSLGARSPHAGGWPLKVLSCLPRSFVHYAYCDDERQAEQSCLQQFRDGISSQSLLTLRDRERAMPYANLEFPRGNIKDHGIKGAKAPRN